MYLCEVTGFAFGHIFKLDGFNFFSWAGHTVFIALSCAMSDLRCLGMQKKMFSGLLPRVRDVWQHNVISWTSQLFSRRFIYGENVGPLTKVVKKENCMHADTTSRLGPSGPLAPYYASIIML